MRLRIGMIGGGQGAFIGAVHRIALALDGEFELVAGCFSRDMANTRATAASLGIAPERAYAGYEAMAEGESRLPPEQRIHAVSIVTPNHLHVAPARLFLERGFHVICDKPLSSSLADGEALAATVERSGMHFALTHNYTGYPMVREARELVRSGALGTVRKVYVEYLQGWLSSDLESGGHKQAEWRTDPARSGPVGALGDIGTHAFNLLEHVSGLRVEQLHAVLHTFVSGRRLDDDDMVLLRFAGGASGVLCSSQVCFGRENGLALRVFGTKGALAWQQEHPNDLHWTQEDGSVKLLRSAGATTSDASRSLTRTPSGHPEGYLEGFANLYRAFARRIRGDADIEAAFPTVHDGVRGLRFIDACLKSSADSAWVPLA
ncbi:MAG: Gfo/Idh/MocA family oxidoreductase [Planctomycetes bacterium]|nr:Gfo/Idh/MocA family oxidoreductase [Planctomycetota bacterium]